MLEEIQNQINLISEKLDLINTDFQSRISKVEKIDSYEKNTNEKINTKTSVNFPEIPVDNQKKLKMKLCSIPKKNYLKKK